MERDIVTRKRSKKIGIDGLNTLEADIMNAVWQRKKTTVREVHESMLDNGYIPYTTVMAAMNNMARKGILKQNKKDRAYIYSAAVTREKMAKSIVDAIVDKILVGNTAPIISYLLDLDKDEDVDRLLEMMAGN